MPNEVYRAAVDGLGDLVPPRVAKRLVDQALSSTRRTPDDVSVSAMRRLLLGPIRDELEGVLPPGAAGPGLKRVAAGISEGGARTRRGWWPLGRRPAREHEEDHADDDLRATTAAQPERAAAPAEEPASTTPRSMVADPTPTPEAPPLLPDDVAVASAPVEPPVPSPAPARPRPAPSLPRLDDALVAKALRAFGALETVRQVVAVRGSEVVLGSGDGLDEAAVPDLALATTRLLGRDGTLKLLALERPTGALFLFPLVDGSLVVLTKPKVNVGAVLAARAALEEAA